MPHFRQNHYVLYLSVITNFFCFIGEFFKIQILNSLLVNAECEWKLLIRKTKTRQYPQLTRYHLNFDFCC